MVCQSKTTWFSNNCHDKPMWCGRKNCLNRSDYSAAWKKKKGGNDEGSNAQSSSDQWIQHRIGCNHFTWMFCCSIKAIWKDKRLGRETTSCWTNTKLVLSIYLLSLIYSFIQNFSDLAILFINILLMPIIFATHIVVKEITMLSITENPLTQCTP